MEGDCDDCLMVRRKQCQLPFRSNMMCMFEVLKTRKHDHQSCSLRAGGCHRAAANSGDSGSPNQVTRNQRAYLCYNKSRKPATTVHHRSCKAFIQSCHSSPVRKKPFLLNWTVLFSPPHKTDPPELLISQQGQFKDLKIYLQFTCKQLSRDCSIAYTSVEEKHVSTALSVSVST